MRFDGNVAGLLHVGNIHHAFLCVLKQPRFQASVCRLRIAHYNASVGFVDFAILETVEQLGFGSFV